jgi:hypothetical protein
MNGKAYFMVLPPHFGFKQVVEHYDGDGGREPHLEFVRAAIRCSRNAATRSADAVADLLLRNLTTGITGCCAPAASGRSAAERG